MSLQVGQEIHAELLNQKFRVKQKLGEGGQGAVFLVTGGKEPFALKWYNGEQSTEDQKSAIRELVRLGVPKGKAGQRFVWPRDLATVSDHRQFGYLMPLIDRKRFAELGEVWARLKPAPGFRAMSEASYQIANAYRALHLEGLCYRDISVGNIMFDPATGDVLICDNDNVGVEKQSKCQVWGTMEYMAPEVILGKADPSALTDLHSLAVLLFQLWVWHHPLHGLMEDSIRSWDLPAKKRVYGESPVFIFHPSDKRNQLPNDPEYATPDKRWEMCPRPLQELFARAFSEALLDPDRRVFEGEWQSLFQQMNDCVISCPQDRAENLWTPDRRQLRCWYCKQQLFIPPRLALSGVRGRHYVLLTRGAQLLGRHVNPLADESAAAAAVGEVVQNPANPSVWGLRNLTAGAWTATFPDGTTREIAPQRAAPLTAGLKLQFEQSTGEIEA